MRTLGVISLEPWDGVWRRNQHLVAQLMAQGSVAEVRFVSPATKLKHVARAWPLPGVEVLTPHLLLPRRRGGTALLTAEVRRWTASCEVLWINNARLGLEVLRSGQPAVYDVTDDWRSAELAVADRAALVRAEDGLAERATTVVCSQVLADRWVDRYGVRPTVVQNGVDLAAHELATPCVLPGPGPHVLYVGTLHRERLDIPLVAALASIPGVGQIDLVGPDCLDEASRLALLGTGRVVLHGPVGHHAVPGIMAGADVLLCPHVVDDFTMSLDAIKSFEYLATTRPIVATPTSGFQLLTNAPGLQVVSAADFPSAVALALAASPGGWKGRAAGAGWAGRARQFALALEGAAAHA